MEGDLPVEGSQISCAGCHARSGMGSMEGGTWVPPITGRVLFQSGKRRRSDVFAHLFEENQPIRSRAHLWNLPERPAYTDQSLARALRDGVDPAGRILGPEMPRYRLSQRDLDNLTAYLGSLSAIPVGVDPSAIHFATVVEDGIDPGQRQAMLAVLRAFVQRKNQATRFELQRRAHAPAGQEDLYRPLREWRLHVWNLNGQRETWPAQLQAYYSSQPVFALIAGMVSGSWQPIAEFCERRQVPYLFPQTSQAVTSGLGHYTVYLTEGLAGEAAVLAKYLQTSHRGADLPRIVQVYRPLESSNVAAEVFRRAIVAGGAEVRDRSLAADQHPSSAFWSGLFQEDRPDVLVLWLRDSDLGSFEIPEGVTGRRAAIYVSYTLVNEQRIPTIPEDMLFFTYPFAPPDSAAPEARHVRGRLVSTAGDDTQHERVQFNAYFAASLLDYALAHMSDHLCSEYLLETIERETETAPNPGVFPRLSLGPGQRFASKGACIVKRKRQNATHFETVSEWMVP
jgi:hypothetical protein